VSPAKWFGNRGWIDHFRKRLELTMATSPPSMMDTIATTVQVLSVVVGVVISVLSFNATREKEAEARKFEASKPFLELRQKLYVDALKQAAVLTNPETHTEQEIAASRKRFRELYVAELSMVEERAVELQMVQLANSIDNSLTTLTPAQRAAYDLAHALRNSFVESWKVDR
jgi:hypothetical protein